MSFDSWVANKNPWLGEGDNQYKQIRGLLYFVDEEDKDRGVEIGGPEDNQNSPWWKVSLNNDDIVNDDNDRRGYWLNAPSAGICNKVPGDPLLLPKDYRSKGLKSEAARLQQPTGPSIGGIISGTLGVEGYDNIYFVNDDLEVPAGQTLTITLGTSLVFAPGKGMNVAGQLIAEGNNVFPIRFINTDEAGWAGLHFQPSSQGSRCLGCQLENLMTNTVALQVEAPVTFQYGFIRDVPGGTAISSTVPFSLSNVVVDYVGTGLQLSGTSPNTYTISHLTLSRCQQGVVNQGQRVVMENSILTVCGIAVSTELSGTTAISYSLLHANPEDFVTDAGAQLVQGSGLITQPPGFVEFPKNFHLRSDSPAVDAADPQAAYSRELGYNGGRADLGAYGNTMEATQRPPLEQMGVTIETNTSLRTAQPGQIVTYTLTVKNTGAVTETYGVSIDGSNTYFRASLFEDGSSSPQYIYLPPQAQVPITVWVRISPQVTAISKTISVRASSYVQDKIELTTRVVAFQEAEGQAVMEAEHFTSHIGRSGRAWITQTTLAGYAGLSYLSALPDTGINFTTTYTVTRPQLSYTVNFTTTGVYTVWVRGYAPDGAGDSIYVGLDNQAPVTATVLTGFAPRQWGWTNITQNGPATIEVTEPGLHTFYIWMREDGLRLDRILLTTDSSYNPTGIGPLENEFR